MGVKDLNDLLNVSFRGESRNLELRFKQKLDSCLRRNDLAFR